jgi:Flp pilus assembly protein TadB
MNEEKKDARAATRISSRTYLILTAIFFLASVPLYFLVHPVAFIAAVVIGLFLLAGAFFSMANERRWLN